MALKISRRNPRILVSLKEQYPDMRAEQVKQSIQEYLDLPVQGIKIKKVYTIDKKMKTEDLQSITSGPLVDPIIEEATTVDQLDPNYDWTIEISYKKGMTDNLGKTAQITIEDYLGANFEDKESVQSTTQYLLKGNVTYVDIKLIAEELLANSLIEDIVIHKNDGSLENEEIFPVEVIHIDIDDDALFSISQQRQLALSLNEMKAIRQYFSDESVVNERTQCGLPAQPTDVELEAIAQTWSEHCKHKIFNATIHYTENGKKEIINSVFKTYIQKATEELTKKCDWLVSVFTDNAGIISFNDKYNICFKVETHNSPSALDPYGGALTGILGVNRDIMGAGNAARTFANTDVFCFAPPNYP
ncbi:MAG: AIR synthase related protein, partial [Chlamydiota bacterium]|nr:AIR synthase related protein [Chlamydiota bacterium]